MATIDIAGVLGVLDQLGLMPVITLGALLALAGVAYKRFRR